MQEALPYGKPRYRVGSGTGTGKPRPAAGKEADGGSCNSVINSGGGDSSGCCSSIEIVRRKLSENSLTVFGRRGCCMCHVVKRLLLGLGANPPVYEVADDAEEALLLSQLRKIVANGSSGSLEADRVDDQLQVGAIIELPVVFVGGELFGGLERIMATHISGELVPILRKAGAIWL